MRSQKSYGLPLWASAIVTLLAAASTLLPVSGCNNDSATGPGDTSEILLLAPKGGEKFKIGDTLVVKWGEQGKGKTDVNAVDISFSPDGGENWLILNVNSIIPSDKTRWEHFQWAIPDSIDYLGIKTYHLANDSLCRIKVDQYTAADSIFETSGKFTILPKN